MDSAPPYVLEPGLSTQCFAQYQQRFTFLNIRGYLAATKAFLIISALVAAALISFGQPPANVPLYVHFGVETTDSAKWLLSARIHFGEAIHVTGEGHLKLTGRVDARGTNIVADLLGDTGSQNQFYKGAVTSEKPFCAQGGAGSGGVSPLWFAVSTNADSRVFVERVKEMIRERLGHAR
jgi:hypothetical protein